MCSTFNPKATLAFVAQKGTVAQEATEGVSMQLQLDGKPHAGKVDFDSEEPACTRCTRNPRMQSPAQCVDGPLVVEDLAWRITHLQPNKERPWHRPRAVRSKIRALWRNIWYVRARIDSANKQERLKRQAALLARRCKVPLACAQCILRVNPKKLCYRPDD